MKNITPVSLICTFITLLFVQILMTGCIKPKSKPEDVYKNKYPSSQYLVTKGIGQTEKEANEQAVSEMSRIFESNISSKTFSRVKQTINSSGEETFTKKAESNIKVISRVKLKGVQIKETWFEKDRNLFYSIAVLDKRQSAKNWNSDIENIDNTIIGELKTHANIVSNFVKYKSLQKVFRLWIKREVFVTRLRVIGIEEGRFADYKIEDIVSDISKIKSGMKFFLEIKGEFGEHIKTRMSEVLTKQGILIVDTQEKSNLRISGNITVEPVKIDNPEWKFARAAVSVKIIDNLTGVNVGELSDNIRGSHLTLKEAKNRALTKVSDSISTKLIEYISQ